MNPTLPYHQAIRGEAEGNPAGAGAMTKDSEEVTIETLLDLSRDIGNGMKAIGRILGLDESRLYNLERENNHIHNEAVFQMLLTWKRRNGSQATYRVLGEALKAAGRKDLREKLYHKVEQQEDNSSDVSSKEMASILTFSHLKKELSLRLTKTDCGDLSRYFSLPPDQVQTIFTSPVYSENLLLALEEKGYIHPSNVNRLTDALTELKINRAHLLTKGYMKLRDPETEYDRFLGSLSAHLTISITEKLCENFKLTDGNKNTVISSQNPGLSFLLTIDEMGIINPSDVSKLATPLEEYRLLQAVAKIHEYQSFVLSDETMPRDEDKEKLFIKCLQQKIKSWFETMTPLPWKKSCQWKSKDLFIASRLVLTNSGSNISSREVDRKCKLHYRDIFTDERLKAETRIILEGQPGSGKTMLSSQLAYDWCCGKLMDIPMVIYLPLKIVDDMTIIQAIKMFYIRKGIPITEEDIESILNSGKKKVCLILDALEEYNHVTKDRSPSEVMRVMTKEKLSNCIVMITARTDYTKHLPPGPMLKIGSFGEDERNEYIEKVFSDDVKRQEEVRELVDNVPFILDLCNIPLLFVLLVHNIDRLKKLQEGQLDKVTPFVKAIVDILCSVQDEEDTSGHLSHQQQESIREEGESRSEREALNMQEEYGVTGAKTAPEWEPDAQSSGHHKHNSTLQREATIKFDFDSFAYHGQGDVSFVSSDSEKDDERYETGAPSTLDQLAFNGLCKGNKQLFWQKNFVDRCVSDSKTWIDAGLLVVEEGTPVNSPDRNLQNDSRSRTTQSLNTSNVTSEIKRGVPPEPDILASDNQSERNPILESKEKKSEPLLNRKTSKYISLQVKFLHKLIQEWFAAKYLARLFWGHKTTEHHYKYQLFREHLANIDPADLYYILRFTCHICPPSFHFIASFLMRDFTTGDGEIPDYIMNCICLCFAEYDGYKGHKFKDIVTEIFRRESVNFSSEDSQLLLRSKVSMLTFASRSKIPIKYLKLSDVVEKITEKALILKADVSLGVLNTLRAIEVIRWDQKLIEQDYKDLIKFIINNEKVEVARLLLPSPPVAVKDEKYLNNLQSRNISVEWIIGANLIHTLHGTTGEWMKFRLPGRMSAKLSSLKPITDETNKTVEQQEDKLNDVPSKGKEVLAASQSGSSAQLVDVQSSKERRFNESTPSDTDTSMVDGEEDSAASSSNRVVDAGLSQSQKRTGDESQTVKQPLENIELEVRTESLRDISASSLSGNPAPSQSADVPHSKKRRFNESTAVVMDVSSSLSGFPVPSQSADVPHSKKRRYNEYTTVVMAGVEDSAASSSNKVVDAGLSQSQKRTGDESLTVKQPLEHIDLEVRTESLRDLSGNIPKEWKNVGRNLGLKDEKLCIIETDYNKQGHQETVYQMLRTWKNRNSSKATYRVLGEALYKAGRADQQLKLYKKATIQNDNW